MGESSFVGVETQQSKHSDHYSNKPCIVVHYCVVERYLRKTEPLQSEDIE